LTFALILAILNTMRERFIKIVLPLIGVLLVTFLFFLIYNQFLLDANLTNLRVSLNALDLAEVSGDVDKIAALLNDAFISELKKKDLDVIALIKLEFSSQIAGNYIDDAQKKDIEHLVGSTLREKEKERNPFLNKIDALLAKFIPKKREADSREIKALIAERKRKLGLYSGQKFQEKSLELSRLYIQLKSWDKGVAVLNKAIEHDPQSEFNSNLKIYLAIIYKLKGDFVSAKDIFREIEGKLTGDLKKYASYQIADCAYRMGEVGEAVRIFEAIFSDDPNSELGQIAQFRAGYIGFYELEDTKQSLESFEKLEALDPNSETVIHLKEKMLPAISSKHRKVGYVSLQNGFKALREGEYHEAIEQFSVSLEANPLNALAYSGKALAYHFLGFPEEAIAQAETARSVSSKNPLVLANLAYIYFESGLPEKALVEYNKAIKSSPDVDDFQYNLGTIYIDRKDFKKAEKHLRKALGLNVAHADAYNNLGYILWLDKKYGMSKASLETALSLEPEHLDAHYNLGVVYYTLGNYEKAREKFIKVEETKPAYRKTDEFLKKIRAKLAY